MFGYILPRKPELLVKEYEQYTTVYCSLCRSLQKNYGSVSKAFLNYDFVFLALIGLSGQTQEKDAYIRGCSVNRLKRVSYFDSEILQYSAACLVIASYYALTDNMHDEGFIRRITSYVVRIALSLSFRKACRNYPKVALQVKESVHQQAIIEDAKESSLDRAADPSATALSFMLSRFGNEDNESVFARLGYLLGRFSYLADVGDDLVEDIRKKRYNPVLIKYELDAVDDKRIPKIIEEIREELLLTRSELAVSYSQLQIHSYEGILKNIIYLGLVDTADRLTLEKKKNRNIRVFNADFRKGI